MNINQELTLNLSADGIPPRLHMVQGDANTRTVVATLWDGAQPYTVPAASAVMIRFRKPDGTGGLYDTTESGAQVTVSGNTVTAPVATQMLAVAGVVQAQVDIYGTATGKAAEKLATFRFAVEVAPSVYPDAEIISSDYFNIIAADIGKAVEAAARAEAAQAAASAAQQGAESARDDAVNAKTAAESAKTAAVAAHKKSEAAQTKAEAAQTAAGQSAAAAQAAKEGAETAQSGAQAAQAAAESAKAAAQTAQTGAEGARAGAEAAKGAAEDSAEDAEAWAVGQRNGADVPSTDPTYHNNAKYYKDQAQTIAGGEFVSYGAPQTLTDAQKQQARDNIGAPAPYEAGDNISITGRIITTKAFPCNPKLTDNWYWGNPVNQRGQTSYTGAGYTIDRWKLHGDNALAVLSGGIQCSAQSFLYQLLEQQIMDAMDGRAVTFSVLLKGNRLLHGTWTVDNSKTTDTIIAENESVSLTRSPWAGNAWGVNFKAADYAVAAGLELGTQQTLCHKEYGEWVLNEIPKFGNQLAECQRFYYQVHYDQYQTINAAYEDEAYAFIMLPLPVAMRIDNPVLTQSKPIVLGSSEKMMASAEAKGCVARFGVNYAAISNAQKAVYSYCSDPEGVTFELSADL
nr:MAG TPA: tail protein [Caudoviricetes sp.]